MFRNVLGMLISLIGLNGFLFAQMEPLRQPVVEVISGLPGGEQLGAGFIIGKRGNDVYILTAAHVIVSPEDIMVTLYNRTIAPAKLVDTHELDVAVIKCAIPKGFELPTSYALAKEAPFHGERIRIIGHPINRRWDLNDQSEVRPANFDLDGDPRLFALTQEGIASGSSGGPVLNRENELMGIIVSRDGLGALAVKATWIMNLLDSWGVPTDLLKGIPMRPAEQNIQYEIFLQEAIFAFREGRWQQALRAFQKADELQPSVQLKEKIQACKEELKKDNAYQLFKNEGLQAETPFEALQAYKKAQEARDTKEIQSLIDRVNGFLKPGEAYINYEDSFAGLMIYVEGGQFAMGSNDEYENRKPLHKVSVSSYFMGKYEVTHSQYVAFLNEKGNRLEGGKTWCEEKMLNSQSHVLWKNGIYYVEESFEQYPMVYVTWYGARAYCRWLSEKTGHTFRLPTEAEWEFAARGGLEAQGGAYAGSDDLDQVGWYKGNSMGNTHPVGTQLGNEIALHDMSGNVSEWCEDWYERYKWDFQQDPKGPESGNNRVLRGGAKKHDFNNCHVAARSSIIPNYSTASIGFRVVRDLP